MIIHAFLKVTPEHRTTFLELAEQVVKHTQAEPGNISYQLFEHTGQANTFVMLEEWQDEHALKQHGESAHFQEFIRKAKPLLVEPLQARKYEVIAQS
nr:putative quinol monooxygenase [Brevibacillus fulvus]